MELVGSSSLLSCIFIFGGGGGGGGLMLPTADVDEDVDEETIGPEVILNSGHSGSVLNLIVEVCILSGSVLNTIVEVSMFSHLSKSYT